MSKKCIGLLFFMLPCLLSAQDFEFEFIGSLKINSGDQLSYKINFNKTWDNKIEGISTTDYNSENHTITTIEGNIIGNVISFSERENKSTTSKADASEFCYISSQKLNILSSKKDALIDGQFKSYYSNGKPCINGTLHLVGVNYFSNQFAAGIANDSLSNNNLQTLLDQQIPLKKDEIKRLNWTSNAGKLLVWDNNAIDHDVIDVYINEKLLFSQVELTDQKQSLEFNFVGDFCDIKIVAVSEGTAPLNTLHALLLDQTTFFPLITSLKKGESVHFNLSR